MAILPTIRASVLDAKSRLAEGRDKLRQRHLAGSPGIQVCHALADLVDSALLSVLKEALADMGPAAAGLTEHLALVAHGGYGRRDVAPYSDVDLMILCRARTEHEAAPLIRRLTHDLFDTGLSVGLSVRTPREACDLGLRDETICTSLMESRRLAGSEELFNRFQSRFASTVQRRWRRLLPAIERSRAEERSQYGETVYLLRPNVKRSSGGLRDIQLLRWIGFLCYGAADPDGLQMRGVLSAADHRAIRRGLDFLLRLRNEMHFHAGKSSDVLDRTEQVRIAEAWGFEETAAPLPVERFMQEYFRRTMSVSSIVAHFVTRAKQRGSALAWLAPLLSHQVEGDFRVGPTQIVATGRGAAKLSTNLTEVLRLTDLANLYDKRIEHATAEIVREAVPRLDASLTRDAAQRFLSLLSLPTRLGELLRFLHDVRALERIIPAFAHARGLLQFNEYHKYTVDEHCLRAVECATDLARDRGTLGRIYRRLKQKRTLHLALLIHDLGKGFAEDHSEVGLLIAEDVAWRLGLPPRETETLRFLVHKHLLMSHLAFRRDTSAEELIVRFAVEVGSPEVLQLLLLLTAADFAAVGPDVWNSWKSDVLVGLYHRTMRHLSGDLADGSYAERHEQLRESLRRQVPTGVDTRWFLRQIEALPVPYLEGAAAEQIVAELSELAALPPGRTLVRGAYRPERGAIEFTIGTYDDVAPGVFHRLTGGLTSKGLQILAAEIHTLADGLVLDRFYVHDGDYAGPPPPERIDEVCRTLVDSLRWPPSTQPSFRRVWGVGAAPENPLLSTQVRIDNSTSDRYTILDIFAADRSGLLYLIARTLFELNLSVALAKIGTYLDQVVDVFYVTDARGRKLQDEGELVQIRARLLEAIDAFEREQQEADRSRAGRVR